MAKSPDPPHGTWVWNNKLHMSSVTMKTIEDLSDSKVNVIKLTYNYCNFRYQHHWGRGIRAGDHSHRNQPSILPPVNDRRSRSPEGERHHRKSSRKSQSSSDGGNAARRQQYLKEDRKVNFWQILCNDKTATRMINFIVLLCLYFIISVFGIVKSTIFTNSNWFVEGGGGII